MNHRIPYIADETPAPPQVRVAAGNRARHQAYRKPSDLAPAALLGTSLVNASVWTVLVAAATHAAACWLVPLFVGLAVGSAVIIAALMNASGQEE